jgi:hypothetical protein
VTSRLRSFLSVFGVSYPQILPHASVVVCNEGHGTVSRALAEGCRSSSARLAPTWGRTAPGAAWAGVGLMVPRGVFGPARCGLR